MKIYKSIETFDFTGKTAITIGTFDGVHTGHKVIIDRLKKAATDHHAESVILTFFPHPRMVLYPDDNELRLLNSIDERIGLLEKTGVDHLIIHPFSKAFSRLSSTEFVRDILVNQLHVAALVIGYDHHFGRNREGSFEHLRELAPLYDFVVQEIAAQEIQKVNVSSTKIRNSLLTGEINAANQFLGYHFFMNGRVVDGNKKGRTIGFPTANLKIDEWYKLIPAKGVYAVKVHLDGNILNGMLNIGVRPTIDGDFETIEVNLFDFDEDIYNKTLTIEFYERIRDEFRFENLEELKKQLNLDKEHSIQILG